MSECPIANRIYDLPLYKVKIDPTQPRKYFNEQDLRELADSIREQGLLQPIMVKKNGDGTYLIIHGERRYRAHQLAALPTIKCIIADKTDSQVQDARIVENLVRADLSDMELAKEFQRRVDAGETHEQIAHSIKKSRSFVTQRLSLMRLPEERKEQLEHGKISFADARVFVAATNNNSCNAENQHCYAVTMESLEVFKLFKTYSPSTTETMPFSKANGEPILKQLCEAYRKDLVTLRRALQ
jgi:ParB/RepB/Spo0J family partition protein